VHDVGAEGLVLRAVFKDAMALSLVAKI